MILITPDRSPCIRPWRRSKICLLGAKSRFSEICWRLANTQSRSMKNLATSQPKLQSAMENKEAIKQRLRLEGFSIINEFDDPPNEFFPDHDHFGDQLLIVLKGSIEIKMDGKVSVLKPGDEILFPAKMIPSAKVG